MPTHVKTRNEMVEGLRIASCFGIVWFHSGLVIGHDAAQSGLGVFLFLTGYFFSVATCDRPALLWNLARQLLLPWAVWSLVFMVTNMLRGHPGASIHLWYLPYIFLAQAMLQILHKNVSKPIYLATVVVLLAPFYLLQLHFDGAELISPIPQYLYATPILLLGVIFGQQKSIATFLLMGASCIVVCLTSSDNALSYTVAIMLSVLAISLPVVKIKKGVIAWMSRLTLGIYLVHPLFLSLLKCLFNGVTPISICIAFTASALFTLGLDNIYRASYARWSGRMKGTMVAPLR